jgi:hypothetical protein
MVQRLCILSFFFMSILRFGVVFSYFFNDTSSDLSKFSTASLTLASTYSYSTGLRWTSYDGYFNDNTDYFSTAVRLNGYNGVNTGFCLDFSSLAAATSTSNSFLDTGVQSSFSVEFIGLFYTQSLSGTWKFSTSSDDASYLWLGNVATSGYTTSNALIKNGGDHGTNTVSNSITLAASTYYPIRIQYGQSHSSNGLMVTITKPNGATFTYGSGYFFSKSYPSGGLSWSSYNGYLNGNTNFFSTAASLNGNNVDHLQTFLVLLLL